MGDTNSFFLFSHMHIVPTHSNWFVKWCRGMRTMKEWSKNINKWFQNRFSCIFHFLWFFVDFHENINSWKCDSHVIIRDCSSHKTRLGFVIRVNKYVLTHALSIHDDLSMKSCQNESRQIFYFWSSFNQNWVRHRSDGRDVSRRHVTGHLEGPPMPVRSDHNDCDRSSSDRVQTTFWGHCPTTHKCSIFGHLSPKTESDTDQIDVVWVQGMSGHT